MTQYRKCSKCGISKVENEFKYLSMEDEAFSRYWALSNLRPLEAHQNMMGSSTRVRHKGK